MSSHFIFCYEHNVLPVMRDGIEETVAGGWRGECLGTKFADDCSAPVRPHLIANVIEHLVSGQFAPDSFRIKECYLAMFATSQFTAAVVPEYKGDGLGYKRKNFFGGTNTDAQRIAYTCL
jgi:hypothetical protein